MQRRIHRIDKKLVGLLIGQLLVQKSLGDKLKQHGLDQRAGRWAGLLLEGNLGEFLLDAFGKRRDCPPAQQLIPGALGHFGIGGSGIVDDELLGHVLVPVHIAQP